MGIFFSIYRTESDSESTHVDRSFETKLCPYVTRKTPPCLENDDYDYERLVFKSEILKTNIQELVAQLRLGEDIETAQKADHFKALW